MEIILDCRESNLYNSCKKLIETNENFKDINLVVKNLEIGDIIIKYNNDEKIIIERKSINDLIASIKDKRYEEQSFRLNEIEIHNHNIIYIIEGATTYLYENQKRMVYSACFSLNYYKGFSIFRSFGIDDTSYIICNMVLKIKTESDKNITTGFYKYNKTIKEEIENEEEHDDEKEYCKLVLTKKNSKITPQNIGEIMLCQIPSISNITAIAIIKYFGSLSNLITTLKDNELPENILKNINYETNGKIRKLNKTNISNIIQYLLK